jgi:CHAT domain-containing protein
VVLVAEREKQLLRIAALENDVDKAATRGDPMEKQNTLARALEAARAGYEDQLNRQAALPGAKGLGSASTTLTDVQSELSSDEALLLYLSGPDYLDLFVVRTNLVSHERIALGDRELTTRVRFLRELMTQGRQESGVPKALGELYSTLLSGAPVSNALHGVSRLLIVPHGSLGALPFAALWDARSGKFLVEEYSLRYLPSVASMSARTSDARKATAQLSVFAPLPDSLPGTNAEALAVERLIPSADLRVGNTATELAVRAALRAGRSIHIASHGTHNSQNPLFSRMIVGRNRGQSSAEDGRLEVHEILGLSTTSPLVFLSGCETALGSAGQGAFAEGSEEGSLAQAFLIAGAGDVVATLWRVDDAGAVRIAESFYRRLRSGKSTDQALTLSQREAISSERNYTWAAYTISGRGPPVLSQRLHSP